MNDPTNQGIAIVLQTLLQQQRDTDAKIDRMGAKLDARLEQFVPRVELEKRFTEVQLSIDTFKRESFVPLKTDVETIMGNRLPRWFWGIMVWLGPVAAVIAAHFLAKM